MGRDAQRFIVTDREDVVIAPNQQQLCIDRSSPSSKKRMLAVFFAVKEISGEYDALRPKILYLRHQPMKILLVNGLGYRNAFATEMSGLAEMQVRNYERAGRLPEKTSLRGKPTGLSGDLCRQGR